MVVIMLMYLHNHSVDWIYKVIIHLLSLNPTHKKCTQRGENVFIHIRLFLSKVKNMLLLQGCFCCCFCWWWWMMFQMERAVLVVAWCSGLPTPIKHKKQHHIIPFTHFIHKYMYYRLKLWKQCNTRKVIESNKLHFVLCKVYIFLSGCTFLVCILLALWEEQEEKCIVPVILLFSLLLIFSFVKKEYFEILLLVFLLD